MAASGVEADQNVLPETWKSLLKNFNYKSNFESTSLLYCYMKHSGNLRFDLDMDKGNSSSKIILKFKKMLFKKYALGFPLA